MNFQNFAWRRLALFFLLVLCYVLLMHTAREESNQLLLLYFSACGLSYFLIQHSSLQQILYQGILVRFLFIGVLPWLSQDFYRFVWDGLLLYNQLNPYAYTPDQLMQLEQVFNPALKSTLWKGMGTLSAGHFSNYPPINQLGFLFSVAWSPGHLLSSVIAMRLLLIAADVGVFFLGKKLLVQFQLPEKRMGWYFLNPLVLVELTGNLHWEGVLLFFFALGCWWYFNQKKMFAAVAFALSVATKLIPLLILPVFARFQTLKKSIRMGLLGGCAIALLFLPFFWSLGFENYLATIQLWFKNFEFNGSLYYIVRWIGYQIKGYNIIRQWGAFSPYLVLLIVGYFSFWRKKTQPKELFSAMLLLLSCYYFMASIVHPWYVVPLVFLSLFSSYSYAVVWSGLVFLSYVTYADPNFQENFVLVGLEYCVVWAVLFYELKKKQPLLQHF